MQYDLEHLSRLRHPFAVSFPIIINKKMGNSNCCGQRVTSSLQQSKGLQVNVLVASGSTQTENIERSDFTSQTIQAAEKPRVNDEHQANKSMVITSGLGLEELDHYDFLYDGTKEFYSPTRSVPQPSKGESTCHQQRESTDRTKEVRQSNPQLLDVTQPE